MKYLLLAISTLTLLLSISILIVLSLHSAPAITKQAISEKISPQECELEANRAFTREAKRVGTDTSYGFSMSTDEWQVLEDDRKVEVAKCY